MEELFDVRVAVLLWYYLPFLLFGSYIISIRLFLPGSSYKLNLLSKFWAGINKSYEFAKQSQK